MNCKKINSLLSEYIDGSISKDIKIIVDEHLSKCPKCVAEMQYLQNIVYSLRKCSVEKIPADLWSQVRTTILDHTPHTVKTKRTWSYKYAVPAFAVIIFIALLLTNTINISNLNTNNRPINFAESILIEDSTQISQSEFNQFLNQHITAHKKQPLSDPDLMFITVELEKNGAVSNNR